MGHGIEKIYEDDLRGMPGKRLIEVDAQNHPVRVVGHTDPIPGDDVILNLDIDVQAQAEQALESGLAIAKKQPCRGCSAAPKGEVGSTVVLDPTSGAKHEWNRYAHVVFRLRGGADEQKAPVIRAVQSDAIVVELGFCRPELRALHVSRVLSTSRTEASCVASVNQFEKTRLWLYVLS